ncbi:MAG: HD domain-containing protein [Xanthomonadales bacterium]|nr:HD domain-containing protein [Xanthomonadales bacterium]
MSPRDLERRCLGFAAGDPDADGAHGRDHLLRVLRNARDLGDAEGADARVTVPAACLHDCVAVPKDSALRAQASRLAAERAIEFLAELPFPEHLLDAVYHAIEAHSYSAGIAPRTLEARVVQDADRLDSLGAIGIARCLQVGGHLGRPLCEPDDPFCDAREPDDSRYTVDHFYAKLLKLPATMQTAAGRAEAERRADVMRVWLDQLRREIL